MSPRRVAVVLALLLGLAALFLSSRQPEPAVVGRDGRTEQAQRLHLLDHLVRVLVGVLEIHGVRRDVALEPAVDRVEDLRLVLRGERGTRLARAHRLAPRAASMLSSTPWPRLGTSIARSKSEPMGWRSCANNSMSRETRGASAG